MTPGHGKWREVQGGVAAPRPEKTLEWTLSSPPPFHQYQNLPQILILEGFSLGDFNL